MQTYDVIPDTTTLEASRQKLLDRDDSLRSSFSGTSFPSEAVVGQLCYRTDLGKMHICTNATGPVFQELIAYLLGSLSNVIAYGDIQQVSATNKLLGRRTAGAGDIEEIGLAADLAFASSNLQLGAFTGDISKAAASLATTIANDAVTYAKMQNVSATQRLIGRNTAGAGDPEEVTITQAIDWIGSTRGQIVYRGASAWLALATGTAGNVLKTGGAGADPSWGTLAFSDITGTITNAQHSDNTLAPARLAISATQRVVGRNTAGAGAGEEVTASQLLDWRSSTQGVIMYRGASTWDALATGTAGFVLQTQGAAANPVWARMYGKDQCWIPAAALKPRASTGCAALATVETTTNKVNIETCDFDATTQEFAQFTLRFQKRMGTSTCIAKFYWKHAATVTNFGVVWGIQGGSFGDNEAIDAAFGTAVEVADTGGTTNNLYVTAATSAMTIANLTAEELVYFQVYRKPADASDTMSIDAGLIGIMLEFTDTQASDD